MVRGKIIFSILHDFNIRFFLNVVAILKPAHMILILTIIW